MSYIGNLVYDVRKKKRISQNELSRGLLGQGSMSLLEKGKQDAELSVMNALWERLGMNSDFMEVAISNEEYELLSFLEELRLATIRNLEFESAYENCLERADEYNVVDNQSIMMYRIIHDAMANTNKDTLIEDVRACLQMTALDIENISWDKVRLSAQELRLILLYAKLQEEGDKKQKLYQEVERYLSDEKMGNSCVAAVGYLIIAQRYYDLKQFEQCKETIDAGKELLVEDANLFCMYQFLELEGACLEKLGMEDGQIPHRLESIRTLFSYGMQDFLKDGWGVLAFEKRRNDIIVIGDMVYEMRKMSGQTQEKFSETICEPENLCRIEKGQINPARGKLKRMVEKSQFYREVYYGEIISDLAECYEYRKQEMRVFDREEFELSMGLVKRLEKELDLEIPVNRQAVESAFIKHDMYQGRGKLEEQYKEIESLLKLTMPQYDGKLSRVPSSLEVELYIKMAIIQRWLGNVDRALEIYSDMHYQMTKRRNNPICHSKAIPFIHMNYGGLLEYTDRLQEAEKILKEGLQYSLIFGRAPVAAQILANLACVFEKQGLPKQELICILNVSVDILSMYRNNVKLLLRKIELIL